jgi:hypothetical protein
MFIFALVLASALFVLPMSLVVGQSPGVTVDVTNPNHGAAGSNSGIAGSQVTVQGTVNTTGGSYQVFFGSQSVLNGTADGYNVNTTFTVPSDTKVGFYNVVLQDQSVNVNATQTFRVVPTGISAITTATVAIMGICIVISFANMALNRALITKMIGWHEYRSMQKEMNEYNTQRMAAIKAQDTKPLRNSKERVSDSGNANQNVQTSNGPYPNNLHLRDYLAHSERLLPRRSGLSSGSWRHTLLLLVHDLLVLLWNNRGQNPGNYTHTVTARMMRREPRSNSVCPEANSHLHLGHGGNR